MENWGAVGGGACNSPSQSGSRRDRACAGHFRHIRWGIAWRLDSSAWARPLQRDSALSFLNRGHQWTHVPWTLDTTTRTVSTKPDSLDVVVRRTRWMRSICYPHPAHALPPPVYHTIKIKIHPSCDIEYSVETHLRKLWDTPIARNAGRVSSLRI